MKSSEINEFVKSQGDKIFFLIFIKRGDGSIRKMLCRKGVKAFLKGGEKKFSDTEKDLVTVFDLSKEKMGYRSFGLESVFLIAGKGERHLIEDFDKGLVLPEHMDEFNKILADEETLHDIPNTYTVDIHFKECDHCHAKEGRAGMLTKDSYTKGMTLCKNCYETIKTGQKTIFSHLKRTDEEIELTCALAQ